MMQGSNRLSISSINDTNNPASPPPSQSQPQPYRDGGGATVTSPPSRGPSSRNVQHNNRRDSYDRSFDNGNGNGMGQYDRSPSISYIDTTSTGMRSAHSQHSSNWSGIQNNRGTPNRGDRDRDRGGRGSIDSNVTANNYPSMRLPYNGGRSHSASVVSINLTTTEGGAAYVKPFNRWYLPPAAVVVHMCVGHVYAWSVFNTPIETATKWNEGPYVFATAIVVLGLTASLGGPWLERIGPRIIVTIASFAFGIGMILTGIAIRYDQWFLMFLAYGLLGGFGIGLGYLAPISTLIKWFPDRKGMAAGLAVMGFGGGSIIAGPISSELIESIGVDYTFIAEGCVYFVLMLAFAQVLRFPQGVLDLPDMVDEEFGIGYRPPRHSVPDRDEYDDDLVMSRSPSISLPRAPSDTLANQQTITQGFNLNHQPSVNDSTITQALRTRQFYIFWAIFFLNIAAGISLLAELSELVQDLFYDTESASSRRGGSLVVALAAAANAVGRFVWASFSDRIGRKRAFTIGFITQTILFALLPTLAAHSQFVLFIIAICIIMALYGGGFSTMPAFVADLFGGRNIGAIHGVLLTAWSAAGAAGPILIGSIRSSSRGKDDAIEWYSTTLYILSGGLFVGFILTMLIKPMTPKDTIAVVGLALTPSSSTAVPGGDIDSRTSSHHSNNGGPPVARNEAHEHYMMLDEHLSATPSSSNIYFDT